MTTTATAQAKAQRGTPRMSNGAQGSAEWQRWVTDTLSEVKTAVDRLPTRQELLTSDANKVDRASYTIAHSSLEQALAQQGATIGTLQQAVQKTNDFMQSKLMEGQTAWAKVESLIHDHQQDIEEMKAKPDRWRTSASFWVLAAGIVLATCCSFASIAVSIILHFVH